MIKDTATAKKYGAMGGKTPSKWLRKYRTPEALEQKVQEYIDNTEPSRATITGLLIHLDVSWDTFHKYQNGDIADNGQAYADAIKKGRLFVENCYELDLRSGKPVGSIFALKNINREEWNDKQESTHTLNLNVGVVQLPERNTPELEPTYIVEATEIESTPILESETPSDTDTSTIDIDIGNPLHTQAPKKSK